MEKINSFGVKEKSDFELCMEEAEKLCNEFFSPEIDNLADQTIGSIVMKVLIEQDIYTEGHLEGIPEEEGEKWMEQSKAFVKKWKPKVEEEV